MDENKDLVRRPGHGHFLAMVGIFLCLCTFLAYLLLSLPLYYYAIFATILILAKKLWGRNQDYTADEEAIFIRKGHKASVCIVGAGFSGLAMGVKLKKAGIKFTILEKSSELGGTWNANKYPGCRCDVWSVLYQLSFYLNPHWSTYVCEASEIRAYLKDLTRAYGLEDHIQLNTGVEKAKWSADKSQWTIETSQNSILQVTHLVSGCGVLREPLIPNFQGMENFKGKKFHSAQWDLDYDYKGQKVAIIGSGATAVQIAPAIVDQVAQLHLFQRTPNWFFPRIEANFPQWYKTLLETFPFLMTFNYWVMFAYVETTFLLWLRKGWPERVIRWILKKSMLSQLNGDQVLADKLTPKYEVGCKRILLINDFLPMFVNKPNAHLITDPIKCFTETGILTEKGTEIQLDCVIFATGFKIEESICGFEVIGKNDVNLQQHLSEFPAAYKGITVPAFPNFFLLLGPNTVLAHNSVLFMIECQVDYIMDCIKQMLNHNVQAIDVKTESTLEFRKQMDAWSLTRNFSSTSCQGWYKNKDGINFILWPSNLIHYWLITRKAHLLQDYWLTLENDAKKCQ